MMNFVWAGMIIISLVAAVATGNTKVLSDSLLEGAQGSVELIISILGIMCFWSGLMEIAKRSGLTDLLAKFFSPFLCFLFPHVDKNSQAMRYMSLNISANLLGIGNAATPFGLKAMEELQKENPLKDEASDSQVLFVLMNTASLQILPTTIGAYRASYGSTAPFAILPCVWLTSIIALAVGVVTAKALCMGKRYGRRV